MIDDADRPALRVRPSGWPITYQRWGTFLFLHWSLPAEALRPLIPDPLVIDTFDYAAWIGFTPFTMWGTRSTFSPPIPFLSESHELNVRTYVHLDEVPGIWFFSLDASNTIAALGARLTFPLPYFSARMSLLRRYQTLYCASKRTLPYATPAQCKAVWTVGDGLLQPEPGSLRFFLIEPLCPVFCSRSHLKPCSHLPPALASARSSPAVFPIDHARIAGVAFIRRRTSAAPAGKPLKVRSWARDRIR
jgi:uncharacterized protein YqjF (DUF2071 family)